jgi:hypothetical protein
MNFTDILSIPYGNTVSKIRAIQSLHAEALKSSLLDGFYDDMWEGENEEDDEPSATIMIMTADMTEDMIKYSYRFGCHKVADFMSCIFSHMSCIHGYNIAFSTEDRHEEIAFKTKYLVSRFILTYLKYSFVNFDILRDIKNGLLVFSEKYSIDFDSDDVWNFEGVEYWIIVWMSLKCILGEDLFYKSRGDDKVEYLYADAIYSLSYRESGKAEGQVEINKKFVLLRESWIDDMLKSHVTDVNHTMIIFFMVIVAVKFEIKTDFSEMINIIS